ncbi:MAG: hydrogenase expression/formation protein HypE [Candidatus Omnitrophota bacterium]|nr:MAG: hydrogenase expression/formation protein HypE [Candidatus Omnitrophota bacterium]
MEEKITLAHGNGGRRMHELIEDLRIQFSNKILNELSDAAELSINKNRISFSTDSYVVKPLFFPGGDIGKLAICGTINDVSMKGARPLFISLAFIIEEGFSLTQFKKIVHSIKQEAKEAGVSVVTGDIKVVEKGAADGIFINTAGIGIINYATSIGGRVKPGDLIVINGTIAEHGMAILNAREKLGFKSNIKSDCRSLNLEVQRCLNVSNKISFMRDLTRGGLAGVLNEIAGGSNIGIEIYEKDIPVRPPVKKLCDILGFDPLYVANEGKFICFVDAKDARRIKKAMGKTSQIIGRVLPSHKKEVFLETKLGAKRLLAMLEEDQLPRIC